MRVFRRSLLAVAAVPFLPAIASAQTAAADDPRLADRFLGSESAPVTVAEHFSLTCSHCAEFHRNTMPRVKKELIEPGKVRMKFVDFPLDQLALRAAMIARSLPAERYEPFVGTLLSTQDRWAFNRAADPKEELAKLALLAGLSREAFDAAWADEAFARGLLERQLAAEKQFNVNSTPTFVVNGKATPGTISFDRFAELVAAATPS